MKNLPSCVGFHQYLSYRPTGIVDVVGPLPIGVLGDAIAVAVVFKRHGIAAAVNPGQEVSFVERIGNRPVRSRAPDQVPIAVIGEDLVARLEQPVVLVVDVVDHRCARALHGSHAQPIAQGVVGIGDLFSVRIGDALEKPPSIVGVRSELRSARSLLGDRGLLPGSVQHIVEAHDQGAARRLVHYIGEAAIRIVGVGRGNPVGKGLARQPP